MRGRVKNTPPPEPTPGIRRAVFFDVENSSRVEHITRVLDHLALGTLGRDTQLVAVGNWRVIGQETAWLLAQRGARLVHSAPAFGVKDWSDLRIAVAAGMWLGDARPGDQLAIMTDDQAFDAVGDVAASLGVRFQRVSCRGLAAAERPPAGTEPPSRARRGRGPRRGRARGVAEPAGGRARQNDGHGASREEILDLLRELHPGSADEGVSLDTLSNALRTRGFSRPPGSLRLVTRLRQMKEVEVSRAGTIRLLPPGR